MTALRDARLQKALEHAPDADAVPGDATRAAIGQFARAAVQPAPAAPVAVALPWWRRLGTMAPNSRMPWNGAFATLLLAGVITLIWRDEPVPGPQLDTPPGAAGGAQAPAPPPAPAPAPAAQAPAPAPASAAAAQPAKTPAPVESAQPAAAADKAAQARIAENQARQREKTDQEKRRAAVEAERSVKSLPGLARDEAVTAPPAGQRPATPPVAAAPPPAYSPAPAAAPPAPAAAPVAPAAPRAESSGSIQLRSPPLGASLPAGWTRLFISMGSQLVEASRIGQPQLAAALQRAAGGTAREPFTGNVVATLGFATDAGVIGVLDVSETHLRWTPRVAGGVPAFEGRPTQQQMQELLMAIRQAVTR
jgi:hypothetical protein